MRKLFEGDEYIHYLDYTDAFINLGVYFQIQVCQLSSCLKAWKKKQNTQPGSTGP